MATDARRLSRLPSPARVLLYRRTPMDGQIKRPQWIVWSTLALCALFGLVAAEARAAELAPLPAVGLSTEWVAPSWRWRRVPVNASGQGQGLLAVAVEAGASRSGRVAIGDLAGVSLRDGLRDGNGAFRFAARVAGVTDLAFAPDGSLWIASFAGLFRLSSEGRLADRSPAPGALSRTVHRVVVGASGRVAARRAIIVRSGSAHSSSCWACRNW